MWCLGRKEAKKEERESDKERMSLYLNLFSFFSMMFGMYGEIW